MTPSISHMLNDNLALNQPRDTLHRMPTIKLLLHLIAFNSYRAKDRFEGNQFNDLQHFSYFYLDCPTYKIKSVSAKMQADTRKILSSPPCFHNTNIRLVLQYFLV